MTSFRYTLSDDRAKPSAQTGKLNVVNNAVAARILVDSGGLASGAHMYMPRFNHRDGRKRGYLPKADNRITVKGSPRRTRRSPCLLWLGERPITGPTKYAAAISK